jgi:hypothetical protein
MKYFEFWQDMSIQDQWFLDEPTTADGTMLDGWNFTMGLPYTGPIPVACKPYQEGREIPVAFGGLDTPYLRRDIGEVIQKLDPTGVQVFPITVAGAVGEYWIVNPIRVIDAIHASSDIEHYTDQEKTENPELALRYKSVWKLVLDPNKIPKDTHIFMLKKYLDSVYVSEKLKDAIEGVCPEHGGKFTEVALSN